MSYFPIFIFVLALLIFYCCGFPITTIIDSCLKYYISFSNLEDYIKLIAENRFISISQALNEVNQMLKIPDLISMEAPSGTTTDKIVLSAMLNPGHFPTEDGCIVDCGESYCNARYPQISGFEVSEIYKLCLQSCRPRTYATALNPPASSSARFFQTISQNAHSPTISQISSPTILSSTIITNLKEMCSTNYWTVSVIVIFSSIIVFILSLFLGIILGKYCRFKRKFPYIEKKSTRTNVFNQANTNLFNDENAGSASSSTAKNEAQKLLTSEIEENHTANQSYESPVSQCRSISAVPRADPTKITQKSASLIKVGRFRSISLNIPADTLLKHPGSFVEKCPDEQFSSPSTHPPTIIPPTQVNGALASHPTTHADLVDNGHLQFYVPARDTESKSNSHKTLAVKLIL